MSSDKRKRFRQYLSADEMEEVLARMPAKHVVRCKLLSKTYYDLIKSPRFIEKHRHYRSNIIGNNIIDVVPRYTGKETINGIAYLPPSQSSDHLYVPALSKFNNSFSSLCGSCNGLLCAEFRRNQFVLWNPATRDHMLLPPPMLGYYYDVARLGYDATTDDYKFVKIHCSRHLFSNARAEFWSMKANSWKEIVVPGEPVFFGSSQSQERTNVAYGAFVSGNLYLLATNHRGFAFSNLLVFDMVKNSFRERIPLPDDAPCGDDCRNCFVTDFMGSVGLVNCRPSGLDDFELGIWVLEMDDEYGKNYSWAKRYSIGPFPGHVVPAGRITMKGKLLLRDKSRAKEDEHFWYDPRSKQRKELRGHLAGFSTLWSFTESIVPLHRRSLP